jgi:parallel beta-helix repeat protein
VGFETSGIDNASGPQHIRVKNVEIKNARNSGVFGVGSHHEFINCLVHHNGKRILDHGLYMTPTDSLIDQCTVYNNAGYGIHIYGGNAKNLVVRNSTVYNHPEAGIIIASGSEDVKVYNNIVRHNAGYGGILIDKALRAKVLNNTVYANSGAGIVVSSTDGRDTVIKNNILFQNKGPSLSDRGARTVQSHNLTADPQFENGSIGDFRLRAGSPAIDAGVTLSEVPTDSKGTPRPRGTEYDVGAFEF